MIITIWNKKFAVKKKVYLRKINCTISLKKNGGGGRGNLPSTHSENWPTSSKCSIKYICGQLSGGTGKGCTHGPNIWQQSIEISRHLTRVNSNQYREKKSADQCHQSMAMPLSGQFGFWGESMY